MSESVEGHYRSLLQLPSPWQVTAVESDLAGKSVSEQVAWPSRSKAPCPGCGKPCPAHDRMEERSWRHLSVMQYKLERRCRLPHPLRGARGEGHHGSLGRAVLAIRLQLRDVGDRGDAGVQLDCPGVLAAGHPLEQRAAHHRAGRRARDGGALD